MSKEVNMNEFETETVDVDAEWDALMADLFSEDYATESNGWETY